MDAGGRPVSDDVRAGHLLSGVASGFPGSRSPSWSVAIARAIIWRRRYSGEPGRTGPSRGAAVGPRRLGLLGMVLPLLGNEKGPGAVPGPFGVGSTWFAGLKGCTKSQNGPIIPHETQALPGETQALPL
jgi:hypothetical protein